MTDQRIKLFVTDDHQIVVEGIIALVARDPDIEVVGFCNDGLQVLDRVQTLQPDVLVLDISLPGLNGLDLCCLVKAKMPNVAIMMFTVNTNEKFITYALENGASGYLVKEGGAGEFCEAIHAVARGEIFLGKGISKALLGRIKRDHASPEDQLSDRERGVLDGLAEGKSDVQIGEELQVPATTIAGDCQSLMRKLSLGEQTELVKYAVRRCGCAVA
jgi:DNA-binding NarL/FixJ family response regulator